MTPTELRGYIPRSPALYRDIPRNLKMPAPSSSAIIRPNGQGFASVSQASISRALPMLLNQRLELNHDVCPVALH